MLPSRNHMALLLQQRLGPNDVLKHFAERLARRVEDAAKSGTSSIEFHIPESLIGMPKYDRTFVYQEITQLLRNNHYDVTEAYAWTLRVSFPLRPNERLYCPPRTLYR
jgi:hypothetical protein